VEEKQERIRFDEMPLHPDVLDALDAMGFEGATPIQAQSIPIILKGIDLMGVAQTGTGKTAAFLLPVIDRILDTADNGKVKALIVVPTRELAMQIDQAVEGFGYYAKVTSLAIYGGGSGHDFAREKKGVDQGGRHRYRHTWEVFISLKLGICRSE
jgi:superfamily II DNA/RNA helicase